MIKAQIIVEVILGRRGEKWHGGGAGRSLQLNVECLSLK